MGNTAANIVRGIWGRMTGKHRSADIRSISWMKEKILKHQDDTTIKQINLNKVTVAYKRPYELLHAYKEIFGREIYLFDSPRSNPTIIDCGANIGISVLYFKTLYPDSDLIAFEPDESNFGLLVKNVELNRLQGIDIRQAAVWTKNGTISFDASESEASRIKDDSSNTKNVPCERLADLLAKRQDISFLKIDIEGAEYEVIKDCAPYLSSVRNMFLEYHGKVNDTHKLNELLEIVRNNGFSVYIQNAADTLTHPFLNMTTNTPYDVQLNLYCYKLD